MRKTTLQTIGILLIVLLCLFSDNLFAQNVTRDAAGNYKAITAKIKDTVLIATSYTYQDVKGETYPVYATNKGKSFIVKTSKAGNVYKMYLKEN